MITDNNKLSCVIIWPKIDSTYKSGGLTRLVDNAKILSQYFNITIFSNEVRDYDFEYKHVALNGSFLKNTLIIRENIKNYDIVLFEFPVYIYSVLFLKPSAIIVYSAHNLEREIERTRVSSLLNKVYKFIKFIYSEKLAILKSDKILTISETLKNQIIDQFAVNKSKIHSIYPELSNSDLEITYKEDCKSYVFLGSFDWMPNYEAYRFFVDNVIERLAKKSLVERKFIFAGKNNNIFDEQKVGSCSVMCVDYIEDLDAFLQESHAIFIPIVSGSGVKMKVIEAIGRCIPFVSTRKGVEGLEGFSSLLNVADSPEDFSKLIVEFDNEIKWNKSRECLAQLKSHIKDNNKEDWNDFIKNIHSIHSNIISF
jgi:polysaccharide biosynthesis protein PslH